MNELLHVMVVDDEAGMQSGVERALRDFCISLPDVRTDVRFAVERASSAEEALEKMKTIQPQILLLDYKLPGMSGLEFLRQLSQRDPDGQSGEMLIVMITAYASLETAVEATKIGAYDFLAKPFTPSELKNVIRKAAGRIIFERQARMLAKEKQQVRFQFISVLAHELKAPLAAIEGYLRIMQDKTAGSDIAAYDRMLDRSLIRLDGMRKLIVDLLDLTRIESGLKKRKLADVDVRESAVSAIEAFQQEANKSGVTVKLLADGPVAMKADRGEIEIILNNLISNAVKYNRTGGMVDVKLRGDDSTIAITVSDTGLGMTAEEASKLFNDFVRIRNEKTTDILGSGLGLSIVKKIALLYGGEAVVQSRPDVGSEFTVTLRRNGVGLANDATGNTRLAQNE